MNLQAAVDGAPQPRRLMPHRARKDEQSAMIEDQEALDLAADWADISQGLKKDLGPQLHSQWIKPIQVGTFCKETGTLDLFLPTEFSANWVADRFRRPALARVEDRALGSAPGAASPSTRAAAPCPSCAWAACRPMTPARCRQRQRQAAVPLSADAGWLDRARPLADLR
jgi:chromosomal replication initiator protein